MRRPATVCLVVSHVACTSVEGAENYFATHLRSGDYFAADEPGHWHGSHAADLIGQAITAESFRHQFLELESRQRQSDIKYQEFTYTAPKGILGGGGGRSPAQGGTARGGQRRVHLA